ncbi:MAG: electron transport complex subunit RsxB [Pseudomonadota bacterium]|jgi:electron transport complex protein RnfB
MSTAVLALGALGIALGALLGWAAVRFRREGAPLTDAIDRILPQTQCGQCGFPGCRPYAEAIARGEADINQCPPGGEAGIRALAELLGREAKPLDADHGVEKPRMLAVIDEEVCIGCTKCIQACPVDAIVGAPKLMHTVLDAECTGCELCIPPCPVDCISMVPARRGLVGWRPARPLPRLQALVEAARLS